MQSINKCPVCQSTNFRHLYTCTDHTVSHETFQIKVCQACSLGTTSPRPSDHDLSRYYLSQDYISHSGHAPGLIGNLYRLARKFTLKYKRKLIEQSHSEGILLDYGCGTGEFLYEMKRHGWTIAGFEPSETARVKAQELTNGTVYAEDNALQANHFDVITLWHVLEHVPDPVTTLQHLCGTLKPHGTLYIAVPNFYSPDAKHYKAGWAGFDVPRHLWHFTKESMFKLLSHGSFRLVDVVPMKLDSFYVSLLSERNRGVNPFIAYTRALYHGLHSNWSASTTVNHSSLIYIAKKA